MEFLTHCSIGQCRHLISNSDLVSALRSENVIGVRVLRLSESSVLLIFDDVECSYLDSDHEPPVPEREDQDGEVSPAALIPSPPDVDVDTDLVTVPIVEKDMDEGLVFGAIGPDIEGSNVEIYNINGSQRKVRLLEDVIQSVQSPAEKRERVKGAKGR
ncbi:hypothetical protein V6N11_017748 [Hibiscus sabdariffa]|uniref:Uncharacterized protein n=1 Tax=Hibiscus sabdariffa TaxID=183260 RepID=A0ABR2TZK8_9ROSI